ncbi:helix-turn-helix transcriptional regulator [Aureimonas psammosilenae]|uniref:helix-turn-helix transcriptional regulator n=1 Tax=Aureimonas psammosilenae TaxID=2495496 RepID=UPI001261089B|nr:helix-turn-helix domain-containing protein [Aureimonas psammosilenae]
MNYSNDLPATGFVTPSWVKRRYQISNSTMYLWVAQGRLPPLYRIGPRAVRFRAEDLRSFEEKLATREVAG